MHWQSAIAHAVCNEYLGSVGMNTNRYSFDLSKLPDLLGESLVLAAAPTFGPLSLKRQANEQHLPNNFPSPTLFMLMHKRAIVTGSAGYLGSHPYEKLLEAGHDVLCYAYEPQRNVT